MAFRRAGRSGLSSWPGCRSHPRGCSYCEQAPAREERGGDTPQTSSARPLHARTQKARERETRALQLRGGGARGGGADRAGLLRRLREEIGGEKRKKARRAIKAAKLAREIDTSERPRLGWRRSARVPPARLSSLETRSSALRSPAGGRSPSPSPAPLRLQRQAGRMEEGAERRSQPQFSCAHGGGGGEMTQESAEFLSPSPASALSLSPPPLTMGE